MSNLPSGWEMMKKILKIKGQRGAAAVEFAIVLSLLIVLLFGIIEFSVLLYDKAMITNASREGARAGIVFTEPPGLEPAALSTLVNDVVDNYLAANLITFSDSPAPHSTTAVMSDEDGEGDIDTGESLTVTVTYQYDFLVLPNFMSNSLSNFFTLTATTVMRFE